MPTDTHTQRALALATQRGLLRASHLQELGIARVEHGVYRLPGAQGSEHETLATIAVKSAGVRSCNQTLLRGRRTLFA